jgi:hypothetical protein
MDYTPQMINHMRAAQPLNLEKCKAIASDFGTSHHSVITKARFEGFDYVPAVSKPTATKRVGPTKAEILGAIRKSLSLSERLGDLTKSELNTVLEHLS